MKKILYILCTLAVVSLAQAQWLTNFDEALATAQKENKPVLVDFTGSDWCVWCMKLDKEVFSTPQWQSWASQHVVLLKLDFPRRLAQSESLKKANAALLEKYNVGGFPTIIILDTKGQEIGRTGYKPGGAPAYIKHLSNWIK